MRERLKRAKRLLAVSALAMGVTTACDAMPLNRTHFGIPRNPEDATLIASYPNFEVYEYCGPKNLDQVRMAKVYTGEQNRITDLGGRGYLQIIKRALSRKHGIMDGISFNSTGGHDIEVEAFEADANDNPILVGRLRTTLSC